MSSPKNVVIVGGSVAGADLARALDSKLPSTHRLILIDSNEFAFWPVSALRAAVVPGWEEKTFRPLAGFFGPNSRHILLSKTRVTGLLKDHVEIDQPAKSELGADRSIPFDVCILALGSTYRFPMRTLSSSLAEAKQPFLDAQKNIQEAQTIVMVGGGPVSIEYSGEILALYPNKSITIIQASNRLLSDAFPLKLSNKLQEELESKGVKVILNERVEGDIANTGKGKVQLSDGTVIDADLIVNASGATPNTQIVASVDPAAVNEKGYILVDKSLKIISSDPTSIFASSDYLAIGDCSASLGGATVIKAQFETSTTARNVLAILASTPLSAVAPPPLGIVVPIGPTGGSSFLPYIGVWGNWLTSQIKGKALFTGDFAKRYANAA